MQALKLEDVSSGYGKDEIIHKISLKLTEPAIYVVLGPTEREKQPFSGQ